MVQVIRLWVIWAMGEVVSENGGDSSNEPGTEDITQCAVCGIARPTRLVSFLVQGVTKVDHDGMGTLLTGHIVLMSGIVAARCGFTLGPNVGIRVSGIGGGHRFGRPVLGLMCRSTCVLIIRGGRKLLSIDARRRGRHATRRVLGRCMGHSRHFGHMFMMRHLSHRASKLVVCTGSRGARGALHSG